jgi:hypothetical protein
LKVPFSMSPSLPEIETQNVSPYLTGDNHLSSLHVSSAEYTNLPSSSRINGNATLASKTLSSSRSLETSHLSEGMEIYIPEIAITPTPAKVQSNFIGDIFGDIELEDIINNLLIERQGLLSSSQIIQSNKAEIVNSSISVESATSQFSVRPVTAEVIAKNLSQGIIINLDLLEYETFRFPLIVIAQKSRIN